MKKRYFAILLAVTTMLLTGCGGSSMEAEYDDAYLYNSKAEAPGEYYLADMDAVVEMETTASSASGMGYKDNASFTSSTETGNNDLSKRKLIRNAFLELETKVYDSFMENLEKQLTISGAYIQNGETTGSAERGTRWAYYTIRVPESKYDSFLSSVSDMANVLRRSEDVQDVTMDYTDKEARVRALETERDTLLGILEKCTDLKDVITVQERITNVQYELDSVNSRLKRYDDLIAYCTVNLSVDEVEKETIPVAEKTLGERIAEQLAYNCADIVDDAQNFAVWFVSSLPYFGIWLVVAGTLLGLALLLGKRSKRKLVERQKQRALVKQQMAGEKENTPDDVTNNPGV